MDVGPSSRHSLYQHSLRESLCYRDIGNLCDLWKLDFLSLNSACIKVLVP